MEKIKKVLYSKRVEILILTIFLLFSLRVISWFEYPNIVVGGDLRPPLVQGAFNKRVLYTWDEVDFGMPSVYSPRILSPSYFFITIFQNLGVDLFSSQLATFFLMYFFASILMYVYVKQLTNGDVIAAFIAALFLTSNVYLVSDREQTAIGFIEVTLMVLPSVVTFTEGIKKKSSILLALSGMLFILTFGTFPNYRPALVCFATSVLTSLFLYINGGVDLHYEKKKLSRLTASLDLSLLRSYLNYWVLFIIAILSASVWIIVLISANWSSFMSTLSSMTSPNWVLKYIHPQDILRLIEKWSFYEKGTYEKPYVFYADVYLGNPLMIVLSYLPPLLAFLGVLTTKSRKLAVYFAGIALLSLILASAAVPELYSALVTHIPFLMAFRESAQWLFFTILSYSVLIGIVASTLYCRFKKKLLQVAILGLIAVIFISSAYPLVNGDVTRNWLNTNIKGSYFPNSYAQLNNALSNEYWALLLPQRNAYVAYNFAEGPLSAGNPYPLIFSKPVLSGLGTEYTQATNLDLLNKVYESVVANQGVNVAPGGNALASSIEKDGFGPAQAIDGDTSTRWASDRGMPQWFEIDWNQTQELSQIKIIFESAYANNYTVETWNGSEWTTQLKVENNTNLEPEYAFSQLPLATKLRINFTEALPLGMVSIWELQVYADQGGTVAKFLGMLGIKYLVLEKNIESGALQNLNEIRLDQNENFVLANEWNEVALYNNTNALQKLYPAVSVLNFTSLGDMFQTVRETEWVTLQRSVFLNSTSTSIMENNALVPPENFVWSELSPTSYEAHVESKGAFVLVFLESYNEHWKVSVNGNPVSETNHQEVNAFANGWLINSTGDLTISVQYETQNVFLISVVASLVLPALLLAFLSRKDLKRISNLICRRLKSMKVKSKQEM